MTGAYDVLARIRAARADPQPAGERCEMCSEADRRRAPACGECRRQTVDVRLPRLLSAVHRHPGRRCAFAPYPTAIWSSRSSRWTGGTGRHSRYRSAWRSSSEIRRWNGRSRSIPGRRAQPNRSLTSRPGTTFAQLTRGSTCSPRTPKPCWCECPMTKQRRHKAIWCPSTPATSSSAGCGCCGTASTAVSRYANTSTNSSSYLDGRRREQTVVDRSVDD